MNIFVILGGLFVGLLCLGLLYLIFVRAPKEIRYILMDREWELEGGIIGLRVVGVIVFITSLISFINYLIQIEVMKQ